MHIPPAQRANLSGYIGDHMLLPWAWVDARMDSARNYWITTHTSGYPSSRPVWGVWHSPRLLFSTGGLIGTHLRRDARVQVNLESADEVVIIEGRAAPLPADGDVARWARDYNRKYHWDMAANADSVWQVQPQRVLAWPSDSSGLDRGAAFSNLATQWHFDPST